MGDSMKISAKWLANGWIVKRKMRGDCRKGRLIVTGRKTMLHSVPLSVFYHDFRFKFECDSPQENMNMTPSHFLLIWNELKS